MSKMSFSDAGKMGATASLLTRCLQKQQRITDYNKEPKLCNTPLSYDKRRNDFCNQSCGAAFNNQGIRRHGEAPTACLNCGNKTYNQKFCSHSCKSNFNWVETKNKLLSEGIDNSSANLIGKKYLIELHNNTCQICGSSEWNGQKIPLVLDHIDGNPYNNCLNNLRIICHNCDAQTATFAGRNKGNGRKERREFYKNNGYC